jgi:hypothetical protein
MTGLPFGLISKPLAAAAAAAHVAPGQMGVAHEGFLESAMDALKRNVNLFHASLCLQLDWD